MTRDLKTIIALSEAMAESLAPDPDEELREAIKDTLFLYGIRGEKLGSLRPGSVADALLPLVRRYADQRATEVWDQGYSAGWGDAYRNEEEARHNGRDLPDDEVTPNPYR